MTDKERILMIIITSIIPGLMYALTGERDKYAKSSLFEKNFLERGDLVFANTTINPNDFMVGFVQKVEDDCIVIREIGSKRLCNYYNEAFTKINKDKLGYEVLEGQEYKTYQKVLKAFNMYTSYGTRFKSVSFDGKVCKVKSRKIFSNDAEFEIEFEHNSKTTIKSIGKLLEEKEDKPNEVLPN